jgi:hypothetical protein
LTSAGISSSENAEIVEGRNELDAAELHKRLPEEIGTEFQFVFS